MEYSECKSDLDCAAHLESRLDGDEKDGLFPGQFQL